MGLVMAKRKSRSMGRKKMQTAVTDLFFTADVATQGDARSYVDTAKELSKLGLINSNVEPSASAP